jgi:3'-phosphoadenosine 5'-phosphosulfate sulfotransferase (PAPS reductase)/FAD synthetase
MAAEKRAVKAKKKKGKAKHSFILTLLLVLAVGYFTISLIDTQLKIKEREKTAEQVSAQYEQQLAENERLQKVADGGSQEDYICFPYGKYAVEGALVNETNGSSEY